MGGLGVAIERHHDAVPQLFKIKIILRLGDVEQCFCGLTNVTRAYLLADGRRKTIGGR